MNWKDIRTLYVRELRSALRERGIVVNSIVIPIVLYPLLMWLVLTGLTYVSGQTAGLTSHVMLRNLPAAHQALRRQLEAEPGIDLEYSEDPEADIRDGKLDIIIDFVQVQDAPSLAEGNVGARVTYDASRDQSATARARAKRVIDRYRDRFIEREAGKLGISKTQLQGFRVDEVNVSTTSEMGRFVLALLLPVMMVVMLAMGAIYPAIDTTAGERETGTWETMMTTATSRSNILAAKYLYVATMSFVAGCLNVTAMMFTMRSNLAPLGGSSGLTFSVQLESIPIVIAGAALLAMFVSAGMLILAAFARTFREGQSLVSPFIIVFILPLMFIQSPSQEYTARIALIPVVNVAMMFRQAIVGRFEWIPIAITVVVEFVCIAAALKLATAVVEYEDFVTGSYHGSFLKFVRQRMLRRRGGRGEPLRAEQTPRQGPSLPDAVCPVVVRGLTKTFLDESRGTILAVDHVSFECREGEIFGLLGANGAGKTSTLRMLSTIITPTAGTAQMLGHDIVDDPAGVRRSLGFYSASTALYPRLTARETIEFFARINQYPEDKVKSRVEALIARFGISKYADVRVEKLSTGMKQKVSIARTVAHNPPILIFDEPTTGLDVLNAIEVQEAIQELRNDGRTVIFSTHIMSEAEKLCDRIAIIHNGRILDTDTLEGLRSKTGQHYLEDIFVQYVKGPA